MKKIIISLTFLWAMNVSAQPGRHDSMAIIILDRMADIIGDMDAVSFSLQVANDVFHSSTGMVKQFSQYEAYMSGPNKMMVNAQDHRGLRSLFYNGKQLAYYSFAEHNYTLVPAPSSTIEMMDSLNRHFGIEFPAADFFYPAFTDDLLQQVDSLRYMGVVQLEGKEYFHIIAINEEVNFQFWIQNDAYSLPGKFAIIYKKKEGSPQYFASFSSWQVNPRLPTPMFDFLPPPGAHQIRMLSKKDQ